MWSAPSSQFYRRGNKGCVSAGNSRTAQTGDRRNAAAPHLLSAGETPQRSRQDNGKLCFLGRCCKGLASWQGPKYTRLPLSSKAWIRPKSQCLNSACYRASDESKGACTKTTKYRIKPTAMTSLFAIKKKKKSECEQKWWKVWNGEGEGRLVWF